MSAKHLPRYVVEFEGRHNRRPLDTTDQMAVMAKGADGKQLRYLVALGADTLIMSDRAELGPLDTQVEKPDEIGGRHSGIVVVQALKTLQEDAFRLFEDYFLKLRTRSGFRITTRTAADMASAMTTGLFGPIYGQIDPLRLGENYRALQVALMYGDRLSTDNVKEDTIDQLISSFPSHGFAIDRSEASDLFETVLDPSDAQQRLCNCIRPLIPRGEEPFIIHLTGEETSGSEEQSGEIQENGENDSHSTGEKDETLAFTSRSKQADGQAHQEDRSNTQRPSS